MLREKENDKLAIFTLFDFSLLQVTTFRKSIKPFFLGFNGAPHKKLSMNLPGKDPKKGRRVPKDFSVVIYADDYRKTVSKHKDFYKGIANDNSGNEELTKKI